MKTIFTFSVDGVFPWGITNREIMRLPTWNDIVSVAQFTTKDMWATLNLTGQSGKERPHQVRCGSSCQ